MFASTSSVNYGIQRQSFCCNTGNLRGLAFFEKDTRQVKFQPGFHDFDGHRFELKCHIILSRCGTCKLLHIDISWCQNLSSTLCFLKMQTNKQSDLDWKQKIPLILKSTHTFNDKSPFLVFIFLCSRFLMTKNCLISRHTITVLHLFVTIELLASYLKESDSNVQRLRNLPEYQTSVGVFNSRLPAVKLTKTTKPGI